MIYCSKYSSIQQWQFLMENNQSSSVNQRVVQQIKKAVQPKSQHKCLMYVRQAIQRGQGKKQCATGINSAKDCGPWLKKYNYTQIQETKLKDGDVVVIDGCSKHIHGHIAIYSNGQFYSDFKHKNAIPYSDKHSYKVYRYQQNSNAKHSEPLQSRDLNNMNKLSKDPDFINKLDKSLNMNNIGGVSFSYDIGNMSFDGFYMGQEEVKLHEGGSLDPRLIDMIVPLKIMYDPEIKKKNIAVSIEPNISTQPDGKQCKKVFYPKQLQGTHFGQIMIQADWIMKQMKTGLDPHGNPFKYPESLKKVGLNIENILGSTSTLQLQRCRTWIVIKDVEKIIKQNNKILIGQIKMGVEARVQKINQKGQLQDTADDLNEGNQLFCKLFTEHYDLIAEEYPQFKILKNLSKASIIAKQMYKNGIKINRILIEQLYKRQLTDKSSLILPRLAQTKVIGKVQFNIHGGCDLTYIPQKLYPRIQLTQTEVSDSRTGTETIPDSKFKAQKLQNPEQYRSFIFQEIKPCHVKGCKNLCSPQVYSLQFQQCNQHSRMRCQNCQNLITGFQKYFTAEPGIYYHFECFKCSQCKQSIGESYGKDEQGQYLQPECLKKQVRGVCQTCNKYIYLTERYFQRDNFNFQHEKCAKKQKCKTCNKEIDFGIGKTINGQHYHKDCIRCGFCKKVLEQQVKLFNNQFCHQQCIPKINCEKCNKHIEGQYVKINDKPIHLTCVKCQKCSKQIDGNQGIKTTTDGKMYHPNCI